MALDDINFQEGEGQDFIVEIPLGTLNSPVDILAETDGVLLCSEIEGSSSIFINID